MGVLHPYRLEYEGRAGGGACNAAPLVLWARHPSVVVLHGATRRAARGFRWVTHGASASSVASVEGKGKGWSSIIMECRGMTDVPQYFGGGGLWCSMPHMVSCVTLKHLPPLFMGKRIA